jgi:hypothetical protein
VDADSDSVVRSPESYARDRLAHHGPVEVLVERRPRCPAGDVDECLLERPVAAEVAGEEELVERVLLLVQRLLGDLAVTVGTQAGPLDHAQRRLEARDLGVDVGLGDPVRQLAGQALRDRRRQAGRGHLLA